ncbi:putative SOS response-associated peptidase YedK [Devosia sp. UYZn731]|uniref:SOS response-associated peptidase family protein n=1 Tax=Devosia sp. UYZn731 TaxID=3156345 RepID=UPI00339B69C4
MALPLWAKELPKATLFKARIEAVDSTLAFRDAFTSGRCLIPADGYLEWTTSLVDGKKEPLALGKWISALCGFRCWVAAWRRS